MRIKVIDNTEDLARLRESWNSLLESSGTGFPFLTFEWMSSWWAVFGKDKRLFILTAEDERGNLNAVAPLMIEQTAGFKILKFIGMGRSDYLSFIIRDNDSKTVEAFMKFLNDNRKDWDFILLSDVLSEGGGSDRLINAARAAGWKSHVRQYYFSPYIPIEGNWQQFLSSKSANFRYSLKRKEDGIKKRDLELKILFSNDGSLDAQLFNDMVEIERSSWKFENGNLNMQDEAGRQFFINYLEQFAKKGWLNLWVGYLEGKPTAYLINFDYQGKIWFYNAAYTSQDSKYGIGSILMSRAVQDAFVRGKKEYDFMRGVETYKERWTSLKRESFQLAFYKKSLRSMLGFFFLIRLRWLLAKFEPIHKIRFYFIKTFDKRKKRRS